MDRFVCYSAFVRTVETGSFVAAGRALGQSASAVGKKVAKLESALSVRLLQRSTRTLTLTPEGAELYGQCRDILTRMAAAEAQLTDAAQSPSGRLRISAAVMAQSLLIPVLADFALSFPAIAIEIDFDDRVVDPIGEGFDAVIRTGALDDSRLKSRQLTAFSARLYASPDYLARRGRPQTAADLNVHACIRLRNATTGKLQPWGPLPHTPDTLVVNTIEALLLAARSGLGIGYLPDFIARPAVSAGDLIPVLPQALTETGHLYLLWPQSAQPPHRLRVFLDALRATKRFGV